MQTINCAYLLICKFINDNKTRCINRYYLKESILSERQIYHVILERKSFCMRDPKAKQHNFMQYFQLWGACVATES